jgi:predicted DNA-binding transcriptional regulator AlpA
MVRRKEFPAPFKFAPRRVAFKAAEVHAWVDVRAQQRVLFKP